MKSLLKDIWGDTKARTVVIILLILGGIGMFASLIAYDSPSALIPFGPNTSEVTAMSYQPPGFKEVMSDGISRNHLMGTDDLGRDVAARLIHGIRTALIIGLGSTFISLFIAILLGTCAGYYGDKTLKIPLWHIILFLIALIVGLYYIKEWSYVYDLNKVLYFNLGRFVVGIFLSILVLIGIFKILPSRGKTIFLPIDSMTMRLLEVFRSVPKLFLLLAIYALITQPSIWLVVIILGMIRWASMTRLIRAEVLKVKQDNYIKSVEIMGVHHVSLIRRHLLPNVIGPIMIAASFSIGTAILIESTLSFLNIGLPIAEVSWGQMLSQSRVYFGAWWLAIPPGFMIFVLILLFNTLGDRIDSILTLKRT